MYSDNLRKLESYLSSLECPVHHCCTQVKIVRRDFDNYILVVKSSCCAQWMSHLGDIFTYERTCAWNCAMQGVCYEPRMR